MVSVLDKIKEMEDYASVYNIPIMHKDSIEYINRKIKNLNLKEILEIGTAIGYSTICFSTATNDIHITSIEKDENRFNVAKNNVIDIGYNNKIELILNNALDIELTNKYDLIIIDAAKGKNIDFFNKFKNNLKDKGFIIIDNLKFHGLVGNSEVIKSKNLRKLIEKIEYSIEFLKVQDDFYVEFVEVGDGLAVCEKK